MSSDTLKTCNFSVEEILKATGRGELPASAINTISKSDIDDILDFISKETIINPGLKSGGENELVKRLLKPIVSQLQDADTNFWFGDRSVFSGIFDNFSNLIGTQDVNFNAWTLAQISNNYDFEVFITMGNRFKEPNFLRVFSNLRKKYGNFGLIAVACIPELALGNTYIMEMGIPSHAVPLFFSGCAKWHGSAAVKTEFPLAYILSLLSIDKRVGH